ncbi:hypothetical protein NA57DRAFT_59920 [Rhizodiscina lignyota]|uniref:Uncharacterized protein n=1 Tax=Rhizodiscina lignyota TaxID=1504668 RepID=A0A9P4IA40_9PEZI|nr:hypothetical protein NA57DRAFT_59920 [Rhizodiscina lignyota]
MFESIANLVTLSTSPRRNTWAEKSYFPPPVDTTMSNQVNYNGATSPTAPRNQRRHPSFPTNPVPPSISQQSYSATRTPSVSSASSSQAQGMLSKMASNSPPGSRLMTPAMTPFPSPADESAPYASAGLGMSPPTSDARRPGMERSLPAELRGMQYERYGQPTAEVLKLDRAARDFYETLVNMSYTGLEYGRQ